jgi:uncharacterized protein (DUF2249 family)
MIVSIEQRCDQGKHLFGGETMVIIDDHAPAPWRARSVAGSYQPEKESGTK